MANSWHDVSKGIVSDFQWITASISVCFSHKVFIQLHKKSFQLYKSSFFKQFWVWQSKSPPTFDLLTKEAWTLCLISQFVFHRRKNKTYRVGTTCGWVTLSFFYLLYVSYCFSSSYIGSNDDQVACDLFIIQPLSQNHWSRQGERDVECPVCGLWSRKR